jgi:hypothetical protein
MLDNNNEVEENGVDATSFKKDIPNILRFVRINSKNILINTCETNESP